MLGKILIVGIMALALGLSGCIEPVACTADAKMCPDGSFVGRNPSLNCEFEECPELKECDALSPCPENRECYLFPEEEKAYCFEGDPCTRCDSGECNILESYPMQVRCLENPATCAGEGEQFSDSLDCCEGLVKAVNTCEECRQEDEALAFDGIPCCEGLEAVDGFCRKTSCNRSCSADSDCTYTCEISNCVNKDDFDCLGAEMTCPLPLGQCVCAGNQCEFIAVEGCKGEGETIPVIASPPECCQGLELIQPKQADWLGISGYCTAKCGNGVCDSETETGYNCPADCTGID